MNKLISISEPVVTFQGPDGPLEIAATAEGEYDLDAHVLTIILDTSAHLGSVEDSEQPSWLPPGETLREHVSQEEATVLARDIFEHWAEKVRDAAADHERSPSAH